MPAEYSPRDLNGIFIDFLSNAAATAFVWLSEKKNVVGFTAKGRNPISPLSLHTHYVAHFFFNELYISSYISYSN